MILLSRSSVKLRWAAGIHVGLSVLLALFATPSASGAGLMPDFELLDTNPNSPRYDQPVSPRDYLRQVSGWYFGHAM